MTLGIQFVIPSAGVRLIRHHEFREKASGMTKHSDIIPLIVFSRVKSPAHLKVLDFAGTLFQTGKIRVYSTVSGFAKAIQAPEAHESIILALAETRQDLSGILALSEILEGRQVILILPDADPDTLSLALSCYPRYVSDIRSDMADVCEVMEKMANKIRDQKPLSSSI